VTRPTDCKLLHRGVAILRRLARWHGIVLCQSCARISTHARIELARLIHRGCHREAYMVCRMRTRSAASRAPSPVGPPALPRMRAAFVVPFDRIIRLLR
jgi:hypothetical protein